MLDKSEIYRLVRSQLPVSYEPLNLTFGIEGRSPFNSAVAIGSDYGTLIYVELETETVISVDPDGLHRSRFLNSSIAQLAACIAAHKCYSDCMRRTRSESEELLVVSEFRTRILDTDPIALNNAENWWSVIVEQAETGQL